MGQFSRRTFMKSAVALSATVAASRSISEIMSWAAPGSIEGSSEPVPSLCGMCSVGCPIFGNVTKDGRVKLSGNPAWSGTAGTICARGNAGPSLFKDPDRLQKPLIRVGERGAGKWREATWNEAYAHIAAKMNAIKSTYGPEAMAFTSRKETATPIFNQFAKAFGSPNIFLHTSTCPIARTVTLEATFGSEEYAVDYNNVKYLLSLGRNYFEGIHVAQARGVMNAISKGAKLVYVDPRFAITAAKAQEWLPIKPGTDVALLLGVINVLIKENLYDKAFVDKYTSGFEELKTKTASYTPKWAAEITGIAEAVIVRIAREMGAAKPRAVCDWGWRGVSSTEEFEKKRTMLLINVLLGSVEVPGGMFIWKSPKFINSLLGREALPVIRMPKTPPFPKPGKPRIDGAGVKGNPFQMVNPAVGGIVHLIPDVVLSDKPYPIKGWFIHRSNPVIGHPNTNRMLEALKKLELVVVCDISMSDTAQYADVVLPECTYLERTEPFKDASALVPVYHVRNQVVKPMFESRSFDRIYQELAREMGLGAYFPWKDIQDLRLQQVGGRADIVKTANEKGLVFFGMKPFYLRDKNSVAAFVEKFPDAKALVNEQGIIDKPLLNLHTPSKKIEILCQEAEHLAGRGIPVYRPVKLKEDAELYFMQGKVAVHTNTHTHNVPWLHDLMPTNRLWMHPATAAKAGIANGDTVEISSSVGKQTGKVLLTEGIRPDSTFVYFGFGRMSPGLKRAVNKGINSGILLPTVTADIVGVSVQTTGVTVKKVQGGSAK